MFFLEALNFTAKPLRTIFILFYYQSTNQPFNETQNKFNTKKFKT